MKPQKHSHFFEVGGIWGSLDQYGRQVDDGTWQIVDSHTFRLITSGGTVRFRYSIRGDHLSFTPLLTKAMVREALAHPHRFTTAVWAVSVAYGGKAWTRSGP